MNKRLLILLVASFLLAFSINLMPALKYPDLKIGILNLIASIVVIALLVIYTKNSGAKLRIFLMGGLLSGVVVYLISLYENRLMGNVIFDVIASIQYPFYLLYITPLFGGNFLFAVSHEVYSLMASLLYGVVFGLTFYFKKHQVQIS